MKPRTLARRLALDVLYEAEIRDVLPEQALEIRGREGWVRPSVEDDEPRSGEDPGPEVLDYARELLVGVQAHQAEIDRLIADYADRWAIQRMPVLDRNILRIAIYELLDRRDIPVPVAINEAVELAKSLSTDDSGRFINGLLGKLVDEEDLRDGPDPARSPDDR